MSDPNKPSSGSTPSQPRKPDGKPASPGLYEKTRADSISPAKPTEGTGQSSSAKSIETKNLYGATQADAMPSQSTQSVSGVRRPAREAYEIIHLIGEGGMGSVHLARDIHLGRWVALKRMSKEFVSNPRLLERFRIEGRAVAALTHFHIVNIFAMAEDSDGPYIAMEYVGGPPENRISGWPSGHDTPHPPLNVEDFVQRNGPMPVDKAVAILRKLCSAVEYAHQKKVIHRDIKPANVLLDEGQEPKLTDFGLARQIDHQREDKTIMGASVGSRGYMAPEQEINAATVDHRADLYSLGGTLWFMLTGQNPAYFRESEVPAALRPLLIKALEKDREKRFKSAAELEQALGRFSSSPAQHVASPSGPIVHGRCVKCEHVHHVDPKHGLRRKTCEMCGANLFDPCLKCGAVNGVWAKFCDCGADLAATLHQFQVKYAEEPKVIAGLRKESRYSKAIARLTDLSGQTHSGLKEFVQWAKTECQETEAAFTQAQAQSRSQTSQAEELFAAFDDAAAARILGNIPEPLRSPKAQALLKQINERMAEVAELSKQVKEMLSNKQRKGLLALANRFLQLRPNSADMKKIQEREQRHEAEEEEACWQEAVNQNSETSYKEYLNSYPGGKHTNEARQLQEEACWQEAVNQNTETSYKEYLNSYPGGKHEEQVLHSQEEMRWQKAAKHDTAEAYRKYLANNPGGKHEAAAWRLLLLNIRQDLVKSTSHELRLEYLQNRTKQLLQADLQRALLWLVGFSAAQYAVIGLPVAGCCTLPFFMVKQTSSFGTLAVASLQILFILLIFGGIGAIVKWASGKHREKAQLFGPLPWYEYPKSVATLRNKYLPNKDRPR